VTDAVSWPRRGVAGAVVVAVTVVVTFLVAATVWTVASAGLATLVAGGLVLGLGAALRRRVRGYLLLTFLVSGGATAAASGVLFYLITFPADF